MERLRKLLYGEQTYEPIEDGDVADEPHREAPVVKEPTFSSLDYAIFIVLGISMLWAWNMFLAAGPYFRRRFRSNEWISNNFQAAEISVSTVTNLSSMLLLTRLQTKASYPKRIVASLLINMVVFTLLALSTSILLDVSAKGYFAFLMIVMVSTSLATALCQNGIFAYVSGFGQPSYTQGIMTGQAIAGVLPCIAQIVSVLSIQGDTPPPLGSEEADAPPEPPPVPSEAALAYFSTACVVALTALLAFAFLLARHRRPIKVQHAGTSTPSDSEPPKAAVPLRVLFGKLRWLASAVFLTFAITMLFPVYTQEILSVRPPTDQPLLLQPATFIPLAFLFWNVGDLLGRLLTSIPSLSLVLRPRLLFALAVSRIVFIGLYQLCNIRDRGAIVSSDFFYLVVVQLLFGLSNGFLGSSCMMGAGEWVEAEEREVAGGFMGLCLVGGLCVGSLGSFVVAGA
ncbi:nucleoside transporter-domain-containing protein [Neohortaea acidophila]|uniref:Nucleoside transporter-domain-containing protein n=1 Tax=Neohortaea acidophila TaxID=245834 RepID=A0A6A6PMS5_9PEZI|nr:nucleoside transporter-domain-containing protein [Neohortaea acidophila]KAF2481359.1 nucleoside transporter-domain-containing protein [Neohortaea acidophila]